MDKSWMTKRRNTPEYVDGVNAFLRFASESMGTNRISCPCRKCALTRYYEIDLVHDHLIHYGISQGYTFWHAHGETLNSTPNIDINTLVNDNDEQRQEGLSEMHTMLQDCFPMFVPGVDEVGLEMGVGAEVEDENYQGPSEGVQKFYNMLKDADMPLYEGCTKHSRFSAIVRLWNMKCLGGWSNNIFTELLEFLNELLPSGASLPRNTYEAKKYMSDLGLECVKIPVCRNGCMLFWKENENKEICMFCQTSKWKENTNKDGRNKRSPAKVLRWFPLKSRLQRLFMSSKTASHMKWHAEGRIDDGVLRHPADGMAWKTFDSQYNDFSSDPRNVRLGLAADGFNPFGKLSISHSTWPVMLIPYNLPPWMCMKRSNIMLSLIIPGPSSPSMKIDVYLEPLIAELKELWEDGSPTYDDCSRGMFTMRAALMWTINDFPAYGDLSGWSTKGRFACPCCMGNTWSKWLKYGKKFSYMGHRRFLPMGHRWRKQANLFDGTKEVNPPPIVPNGDDIMRQLENEGIVDNMHKRKRTTSEQGFHRQSIWKKRSIFFELPYWKTNLLRHNLDVMHIEKNVIDNIVGTLLNIDKKSKDNLQARNDLQDMGLRPQLHPIIKAANKTYLPPASFTMSNVEKDDFLKMIKNVKMPDGYASNISRCVKLRRRTIEGMKSHDGHILMQQLLPIALRKSISKKVTEPLIELSAFFREICSKTLRVEDLDRLESRIPYILCQLEMIFPPGFFTIMVHLTVHLVTECKLGGPVHYRWMYPIERYLHRLKFHVRNKAAPEGSISEGYLLEELLTFCSRYLESAQTVFNRPSRNPDDSRGEVVDFHLDKKSLTQAHRYILFNIDDFIPFRKIHMEVLRNTFNQNELSENNLQKKHRDEFCQWFRDYVLNMDETQRIELGCKIELHSKGLIRTAKEFKRFVINGTKFRTKNHENGRTTQNSGISVCTEDGSTWYGMLTRIIEVQYYDGSRYVLFKCDWVDVPGGRGYKEDEFGFSLVNFSRLIHTGERITDDPFVLSSQVSQVFYVANEREPNWVVVVKTKPRDIYDIGREEMTDNEDEYVLNAQNNINIDDSTDVATEDVWVRDDIEGITINLS